ncbi:MAG: hypothetical protein KDB00_14670 [Planctomycetales bacterium]|nr:hypothetical protein [Planctomycetales bacterium]
MTAVNMPNLILARRESLALIVFRLICCCVLFVVTAVQMAQAQGVIGYLFAAFVALFTLVAIAQMLPGRACLRIADDGLTFTSRFCVYTIPWSGIDRFFVVDLNPIGTMVRRVVGFNYVRSYEPAKLAIRRMTFDRVQFEAALPGAYCQEPEDLAEVLNKYLARFKSGHGEPSGEPESPMARDLES